MTVLGIDIGGSGIKGAPVDPESGTLVGERFRIPTPQPAKPADVADVVGQIVRHFGWSGPVGATFPGVVVDGTVHTAANVHKSWIGTDAAKLFGEATGQPVTVLNDADAAGVAELRFGAGKGRAGTVVLLTFGTGIGSALFRDGLLVPNTEFGHLEIRGKDAEKRAADSVRELHDLSWGKWAGRVDEYLEHLVGLLAPALVIVGGGVSKKADKFLPLIDLDTEVVAATLQNEAGIVGAALAAG
jgi:polyphosphate glucokinase